MKRHRRVWSAGLVALVCLGMLAACTPRRSPGDFYDAPAKLRFGLPGTVIWANPIDLPASFNAGAYRVMYHSRDAQNRDVAVTGTIYYPKEPAPRGGWPVISWGHGTSGLSSSCAPSRNGAFRNGFGLKGVVVASDYVGLGPNGQRHAYLSGKSEGHSIIDIVRAACWIKGVHASRHWVTVGVSQGGHATLFAGELACSYAPELDLKGIVAAAPGSGLLDTYPGDSPLVVDIITLLALYGGAVDHPQVHPDDYVTPLTASKAGVLDTGCLSDAALAFAGIPRDQMFKADPRLTEPARSVAIENNPGRFRSSAPILLVQGTADTTVVPARTAKLLSDECALHQPVSFVSIPGGTHDSALSTAAPQVSAWLNDRMAGVRAPTSCPG